MAGNYAGNSLPTTPIAGDTLYTGRYTTYENYVCTKVYANAAAAAFTYNGQAFLMDEGDVVEMVINPSGLAATPNAAAVFLCYENHPLTGTTAPSAANGDWSKKPSMRPTIIGGGGLNN